MRIDMDTPPSYSYLGIGIYTQPRYKDRSPLGKGIALGIGVLQIYLDGWPYAFFTYYQNTTISYTHTP